LLRRLSRPLANPEKSPNEVAERMENLPTDSLSPDAAIETAWEEEWRDNVYRAALTRVRQRVNPKHFQVFDGCVIQGLPSAEVAQMLGMNAAQVYLARHRVTQAIKRAAAEVEEELGRSPE